MVGPNNQNQSHLSQKPEFSSKAIIRLNPALADYDYVKNLLLNGIDGFSLQPVNGPKDQYVQLIKNIRQVSQEIAKEVAIFQELTGPRLCLGDFAGVINVQRGQSVTLAYQSDYIATGHLPIRHDLSAVVKRGERLQLFSQRVNLVVTAVRSGVIYTEAQTSGVLIKDKEIVLPDTDFAGNVLTAQDRNDLIFGTNQDVDYVSLGFIQSAADVASVKQILSGMHSQTKLAVNIKSRQELDDLENVISEADMLIVDTNSLASALSLTSLPERCRKTINACRGLATPVVVKAPMVNIVPPNQTVVTALAAIADMHPDGLLIESVEPTQDIAAVTVVKKVISGAFQADTAQSIVPDSFNMIILQAVLDMATKVQAKAIVTDVGAEEAAIGLAACRKAFPVVALTDNNRASRQLAVIYGVETCLCQANQTTAKLDNLLKSKTWLQRGDIVVTVSNRHPGAVGSADTIKIRIIG